QKHQVSWINQKAADTLCLECALHDSLPNYPERTMEKPDEVVEDFEHEEVIGVSAEDALLALERRYQELHKDLTATAEKEKAEERSEEHTSELHSREKHVCRLLPEKKQYEPI